MKRNARSIQDPASVSKWQAVCERQKKPPIGIMRFGVPTDSTAILRQSLGQIIRLVFSCGAFAFYLNLDILDLKLNLSACFEVFMPAQTECV